MKVQRIWVGGVTVAMFVTFSLLGMAHAQVRGEYPDLSPWANTWFKVKLSRTVYCFDDIGVKPQPSAPVAQGMGTAYINIKSWSQVPATPGTFMADIYARNHETGEWDPIPFFEDLEITYFAGSDLKFIGSAQLVIPNDVTLNLVFIFTGKKYLAGPKAGSFILDGVTKLSTVGSSMLEIDDVPGSTERWAGSVTISGPMVSSIPFTPGP